MHGRDGGAELRICASNPLSTQDDVAAALVNYYEIPVFAVRAEDNTTYFDHLNKGLDHQPHITMDDGADLVSELHKHRPELLKNVLGGTEETPSRPLRIVVGFEASGGADIAARLVAHRLNEALGQNVVVENRPGAGGTIAAQHVANATPDGHMLLMIAAGSATIYPATRSLPYNIQRDFAPISLVAIGAYVLSTSPATGLKSVSELISAAKGQPGKITYGTSGTAGTGHICGLLFEQLAGVKMLHVPYKGGYGAIVGAAGRDIALSITAITSAQPLLDSGEDFIGGSATGFSTDHCQLLTVY